MRAFTRDATPGTAMPDRPLPSTDDLHADAAHGKAAKRKRKSEGHIARSVAGAMAGEAIAAVTGHGRSKSKDKTEPDG